MRGMLRLCIVTVLATMSIATMASAEPAVKVPVSAKCPGIWITAVSVGWKRAQLAKLDTVAYRESRCTSDAFNPKDPLGGSIGLVQINKFWCKPNRYSKRGWLQEKGILTECSELFDAKVNLSAALAIWNYSELNSGNGWSPWRT